MEFSRSSRILAQLALGLTVVASCANRQGSTSTSDPTATMAIALANVPTDVSCLELTVAPQAPWDEKKQLFTVSPGDSATLVMEGLPPGSATCVAQAFPIPCAQVQASTNPVWVADAPIPLTLTSGTLQKATLVLRRPGGVLVTTTFDQGSWTVSPTKFDFGDIPFDSYYLYFTLTNSSDSAAMPPEMKIRPISPADSSIFIYPRDPIPCSALVPAHGSCAMGISFTAKEFGKHLATLSVGDFEFPVTATVVGSADWAVSPSSLDFGTVVQGQTASLPLTVTNVSGTLQGSPPRWRIGPDAEAFNVVPGGPRPCSGTLTPGDSCTMVATFSPQRNGPHSVNQNVGTLVPFTGVGVDLVISPNPLGFGNVPRDGIPPEMTVTVTNALSTAPALVPPPIISGPDADLFSIEISRYGGPNPCSDTLAGGSSCTFSIRFNTFIPKLGAKNATFFLGDLSTPLSATLVEPTLSIVPNPVAFGGVAVGGMSSLTLTIANPSADQMAVPVAGVTGTDAAQFAVSAGGSSPCPATLTGLAQCTLLVNFAPTSAGDKSATLVLGDATAPLTGTGVQASLAVVPNAADFGRVTVGGGNSYLFTVTNASTVPLGIPAARFDGTDAGEFSSSTQPHDNPCLATLDPGSTCTVLIQFSPTSGGPKGATLSLGGATASLTAYGVVPDLTLAPNPASFGNVAIGKTASVTLTYSNPSSVATKVPTASITGNDAAQFTTLSGGSNPCSATLPANASCTLLVSFTPTSAGAKSASIALDTVSATLSGSGVVPELTLSPNPVSFGNVTINKSSSLTLTISNPASVAATVPGATITGADAAQFTTSANTCAATLGAAASCTMVVTFKPTSAGAKSASIAVGNVSASLSGSGVALTTVYAINCGSNNAVAPFAGDQYASGGTQRTVSNSISMNGVNNAAPQAVYQSERYGNLSYTFPNLTPSTQYTIRLHFAELYQTAAGQRSFNVAVNCSNVLSNFDIYSAAGGNYKAVVRELTASATSAGQIVIQLTAVKDNATISGIEILK